MKTYIYIIILTWLYSCSLWGQSSPFMPVDMGTYTYAFNYTSSLNTLNYANNTSFLGATPARELYYKFTIDRAMEITIKHCGSDVFDTHLTVIGYPGLTILSRNDNYSGEGGCSKDKQAYIKIKLGPGTYGVISEGDGSITTNMQSTILTQSGDSFKNPFDLGEYAQSFGRGDIRSTKTYNNTSFGKPTNDIHYKLTLLQPMNVFVSHCGSPLADTYMSILNSKGELLYSNDNYTDVGACSNTKHAYIEIKMLPAGTYYVVSEGATENGDIYTRIDVKLPQRGDSFKFPLNAGGHKKDFSYSDTRSTTEFTNAYSEKPTNDVYYRFSLSSPMDIVINHCGSGVTDTYMSILSSTGTLLYSNDNYSGAGQCNNTLNSYLKIDKMPAGTYYVVSEGATLNGSITTNIQGTLPVQEVYTSNDENYIQTIIPTVESTSASSLDLSKSLQTIQYLDGLGRPVQTVIRGITPSKQDLVTYQEYDASGREGRSWLPTTSTGNGAFIPLNDLKTSANMLYQGDTRPFSEPEYEASPLNRIQTQYGAGQAWKPTNQAVRVAYLTNSVTVDSLSCVLFEVTDVGDSISLKKVGMYAAGLLSVTRILDEDNNRSYEFKDQFDKVILTRKMDGHIAHDTYQVYDNFRNLRLAIPPIASDILKQSISNTPIKDYVYIYKYDSFKRCVRKKLPGAGWINYVYDKADRLIFSQDGEQRAKKPAVWTFSIPDVFGRIVLTGICNDAADITNANYNTKLVRADYDGTATYLGYKLTDIVLNLNTAKILTANYYDNYKYRTLAGLNNKNLAYVANAVYGVRYGDETVPNEYMHKGLLTGSVVSQLDDSYTKLYATFYYDNKKQLIQSKSTNHLGGIEKEYIAYNFMGQPTKRQHIHEATGKTTQTEYYTYEYDHAGRLKTTKHQWKEGTAAAKPEVILVENTYDELGRLKKKVRNGKEALSGEYTYDIRSRMSLIREYHYHQDLAYTYNGNVKAMSWVQEGKTRAYTFTYDQLSRLIKASYAGIGTEKYGTAYTYDKHGNMNSIYREGATNATAYAPIDRLKLNYTGNQLMSVYDTVPTISYALSSDFKNHANFAVEYTYNTNGAMTKDLNKGISDIKYNILNLPQLTDIKSPVAEARNEYLYSSTGQKLRVVQKWNPNYSKTPVIGSDISPTSLTETKTTDYVGNIIYENSVLKRILIDGGYIEGGEYYFYIADHLGNNRLVSNSGGGVVQRSHYYPFGMAFADKTLAEQNVQPYKFGGKELDQMHGLNQYDFHARLLETAIPRFTTLDPMAEKYYSISPYVYVGNNPMNITDPTGMYWVKKEDKDFAKMISDAMKKVADDAWKEAQGKYKDYKKALLKGDKEAVAKIETEMKEIGTKMINMETGIAEVKAMGEDEKQAFTFNMVKGEKGETYFDEKNVIVMDISGNGSITNGIHEASHGYDLFKNGIYARENYLSQGEVKAYGRQYLYNPQSMPNSYWGNVTKVGDIIDNWVIGIQHNGEFLYGEFMMGKSYNAQTIKNLLDNEKKK